MMTALFYLPQISSSVWYFIAISSAVAASLYLIRKYFAGAKCTCTTGLNGKTVLITGANSGIGKETAIALARKGARVIIACRNMLAAIETVTEIKNATGNNHVLAMALDLSSFASVRKFVSDFLNSETRLDILINNAGIFCVPNSITEDGNEIVFQTNYLGHFLLTLLLVDCLKASAPSRIINVSSMAYKRCPTINFLNLKGEENYHPMMVYSQSKLAQIFFTRTLAKKLKGHGVTVNALHPGVVETAIFKHYSALSHPIMKILNWPLVKLFFKSAKEGAQTSIHCALSRECEDLTGHYFRDGAIEQLCPNALDEAVESKLWSESLKLVGLPQQ